MVEQGIPAERYPRGGSDKWDDEAAGAILTKDFFGGGTSVAGTLIKTGVSLIMAPSAVGTDLKVYLDKVQARLITGLTPPNGNCVELGFDGTGQLTAR